MKVKQICMMVLLWLGGKREKLSTNAQSIYVADEISGNIESRQSLR